MVPVKGIILISFVFGVISVHIFSFLKYKYFSLVFSFLSKTLSGEVWPRSGLHFSDCSYNFTLVNVIRCSECKKTSLTSLCGTRYTVYGDDVLFFLFQLFIIHNVEKKNCDVP